MDQRRIGVFIMECRRERGLTQAQLAERLNITDRAVSKWETGKNLPDSSIMLALCGILGVTADELLSGGRKANLETDSPPPPSLPERRASRRAGTRRRRSPSPGGRAGNEREKTGTLPLWEEPLSFHVRFPWLSPPGSGLHPSPNRLSGKAG